MAAEAPIRDLRHGIAMADAPVRDLRRGMMMAKPELAEEVAPAESREIRMMKRGFPECHS